LLEVDGDHQGRGVGAAAYKLVEKYVGTSWPEVRTLRLAVVDTNVEVAAGFWRRKGFELTGEEKPYRYDKLESVARLYEKQLCWGHADLEVKTSGIAGQGLFAGKAIPKGTVVARLGGRNYGTSTGVEYEMTCNCGSPLCRGIVTGEDWKRPELQARYGDHWIPTLLKKQRGTT
jgi:hypothetical protein